MAEEHKVSPERQMEILQELVRALILKDWLENRIAPTKLVPGSDFRYAKILLPRLSLKADEFNQVVLPILKDAAGVTIRCKDVLPNGVMIKRKFIKRDPETKEAVSTTEEVSTFGCYQGQREVEEFGREMPEEEDEASDDEEENQD